jgi:hypothetical protein
MSEAAERMIEYIAHRDALWKQLTPDEHPSAGDVRQLRIRNVICTGVLDRLASMNQAELAVVFGDRAAERLAIEVLRCKVCATFVQLCEREIAGRARRGIVTIVPNERGGHALVVDPALIEEPSYG